MPTVPCALGLSAYYMSYNFRLDLLVPSSGWYSCHIGKLGFRDINMYTKITFHGLEWGFLFKYEHERNCKLISLARLFATP